MDTTTLTQHPPTAPPVDPSLIAHGAQCTWWNTADHAAYDGNRLRCPQCFGPLNVNDTDGWEQLVQSGADQYADQLVDVVSYEDLTSWLRGRCYPTIDRAAAAYRQHDDQVRAGQLQQVRDAALPADAPGAWIRDAIDEMDTERRDADTARARLAGLMPDPAEQERAARRIVDAMPIAGRQLTIGEGLAILAVALEAIGVLEVAS